jgi:Protein of unknown function (DUF1614)
MSTGAVKVRKNTLIGADSTNLDKVRGLGAPVASIGGAGMFDGIFLAVSSRCCLRGSTRDALRINHRSQAARGVRPMGGAARNALSASRHELSLRVFAISRRKRRQPSWYLVLAYPGLRARSGAPSSVESGPRKNNEVGRINRL